MPSQIRVHSLDSPLVRNAVHVLHHQDLYVGFLLPAIGEQVENDAVGSPLETELRQIYAQWAQDEVAIVGVVALYHLWERQAKTLFDEQFGRLGRPVPRRSTDTVTWAKGNLVALDSAVDDAALWAALEEARRVTNCFKHGLDGDYEALERDYPVYFVGGAREAQSRFRVPAADLERLCAEVSRFWEEVPHTLVG